MNIQEYSVPNATYSYIQQVLYNRGIPLDEQAKWLSPTREDISGWQAFGEELMSKACELLFQHIYNKDDICIIVDSDCDGYTSAAIIYNYLVSRFPQYTNDHVYYILHSGKQHGFNDVINELFRYKLVIAPDGGTNDFEAHQKLKEAGIDCLILDHHDAEPEAMEKSPAFIINVQTTDYPNKNLTGAGVAWQFCRAFEDIYGNSPEAVWELIDLCAIGNIGDMADYRNIEIRAIVLFGMQFLKKYEMSNAFMGALAVKNTFIMSKHGGYSYESCAFGIVPFINAVIRSGTEEEKKIVFEAFLKNRALLQITNTKRGFNGTHELYKEALLICDRVKRRQNKLQDEIMDTCEYKIHLYDLAANPVILVCLEPDEGNPSINGLVANKLQSKYHKPCAVLIKTETDEGIFWNGSMRNCVRSPIENFKDAINESGFATSQGHQSAASFSIKDENIPKFMDAMRELCKDVDDEPCYWVDYSWNLIQDMPLLSIKSLCEIDCFGQNMPHIKVAIKSLDLGTKGLHVYLMGKQKNTIKVQLDKVPCSFLFFGANEELYQEMLEGNKVMTVFGKCEMNYWEGRAYPQVIVEKYELREEYLF